MAKKEPRRQRRMPQRTCVVCRRKTDKRSLTRVVMVQDEDQDLGPHLVIDPTGKRNGRGAYLCDNPSCWDQAARTAVLENALRTSLSKTDRKTVTAHIPINPETGEQ